MPGKVLSAKTGKEYIPKLGDLGVKKPPSVGRGKRGMHRQASSGLPSNANMRSIGGPNADGLDFTINAVPQ